jgi:hypothetical protein
MRKIIIIRKVSRLIPISEILRELKSDTTDEELLERYQLTWSQLEKIYSRLFHGGLLSEEDLARRLEMRSGKAASHIPFVRMENVSRMYHCSFCGFDSAYHFSTCPRCSGVNLRRLRRKLPRLVFVGDGEAAVASP